MTITVDTAGVATVGPNKPVVSSGAATEARSPNRAVIEKWVEALESGDYTQAHGTLREFHLDGTFSSCCLDVLCDLAVNEGVIDAPADINKIGNYTWTDEDGERFEVAVLPDPVAKWAGLDRSPEVTVVGLDPEEDPEAEELHELTSLNDDHGATFRDIAGYIRTEFL